MRDVVEVTDEVLFYQPVRGQDWCAEQIFDMSCNPDSEEVSYHTATMRGDEERRPCLETDEQHRNTKTNSIVNHSYRKSRKRIYLGKIVCFTVLSIVR